MTVSPHSAMILAAGLATRMRPLTDFTAKPLLTLGGRTLLDHALDHLVDAGVETVAVNAHWQAGIVAAHLEQRPPPPKTVLLREEHLLETGGGVRAALNVLGPDPFFVVNGDAFWLNGPMSALLRLASVFDDVVLAPWNDLEALESILSRHGRELAAIITEPIMANMGCILPRDGYLQKVCDLAHQYGALFILDEVVTGFRYAPGGCQQHAESIETRDSGLQSGKE